MGDCASKTAIEQPQASLNALLRTLRPVIGSGWHIPLPLRHPSRSSAFSEHSGPV